MTLFEWDESKRAANLEKHGLDFIDVVGVFEDAWRVERPDERRPYGEDRKQCIGVMGSLVIFVAYTRRAEVLRIISARKASSHERKTYYENRDRSRR